MTTPCTGRAMPHHCADKFEEISRCLGKIDRMAEDVRILRAAVTGNGDAAHCLLSRVDRLEQQTRCARTTLARWSERVWKLMVAAALVVLGVWVRSERN